MKHMNNWLQFFAEGTADTNGAAGVDARSEERRTLPARRDAAAALQENKNEGAAAGSTPLSPAAFTWEDVLARDDMKQHISEIVSQRVGDIRKRYKPMMETLASHHGIVADKDGHYNENDIIRAVTNDPAYYDKTAGASGISDPAAAQQIAMMQEQARRREQEADEIIRNINTARHVEDIRRQAEQLKQKYPSFDLMKALDNQAFRYYISPQAFENGHGMTVEQAYLALYGNDVIRSAAGNVANAYASAASRNKNFPEENQNARQNNSGIPQKRFSEMTDEEFAAAKKQVVSGKYPFH